MPEMFCLMVSLLSGTLSFWLWKADLCPIVVLNIYTPVSLDKWVFPSCFASLSDLS